MQPTLMMPPDEGQPDETDAAGESEICIKVAADGSLSVYREGGQGESQPQPVADIGQALKAALELYRSIARPEGDAQDQFALGFGDEAKSGAPRGLY
jgi:hypothetical protein